MFSWESYKAFKNIYFTEHLRATASVFFVFFSEILVEKAFWMILEYFIHSSCKLSLSKFFGCFNRCQDIVIYKCQNSFNAIASLELLEKDVSS